MDRQASLCGTQAGGLALITGATGGLGSAFARQLAAKGFTLILVDRTKERLEQLARGLQETRHVQVEVQPADLTDLDSLKVVEGRIARDPAPTLVVNCAGAANWGRFADLDVEAEEQVTRLNIVAPMRLTRAALPGMIARGNGAVINVASVAGLTPIPFCATYSGTKAFLLRLTEALHEELRGTGVRVQALCPGFIKTEFLARAGADSDKIPLFVWTNADAVVRRSLADLRRNRVVCVPRLGYRLLTLLLHFVPRSIALRCTATMFGRFDAFRLGDTKTGCG